MVKKFVSKFQSFYSNLKFRWGRRAGIFAFCLLVSALFWILKSLDQNYSVTMPYPVRYTNQMERMVLFGDNPEQVYLSVSGRGYDLIRLRMLSASRPLTIDLSKIKSEQINRNDSFHVNIGTKNITGQLMLNLNEEIKISDIYPDTLHLTLSRKVIRKVPVKVQLQIKAINQYVLKHKPYTVPDKIIVSGPQNVIDTISNLQTEVYKVDNDKPLVFGFVKIKPVPGLSFSRSEVVVYIEREKYTEKDLSIPIFVRNCPDSLNLKLFPTNIEVSCNVGLSMYKHVNSSTIKAYVDYNDIQNKQKLEVHLVDYPEYIRLIDFKPKIVDYIIEKWH
jgi:hypothetical protein